MELVGTPSLVSNWVRIGEEARRRVLGVPNLLEAEVEDCAREVLLLSCET